MANVIEMPEKTAAYSFSVYQGLMNNRFFNPDSMKNRELSEFAALSHDEKYPLLPEQQRLTGEQQAYVRNVAIDSVAEKIFQERLKEWGKPFRVQIKLDWIRNHLEFPTEKQILAKTKELYIAIVPQEERDAKQAADKNLATYKVDHALTFEVSIPVNLVPAGQTPINREPLYPQKAATAPTEAMRLRA